MKTKLVDALIAGTTIALTSVAIGYKIGKYYNEPLKVINAGGPDTAITIWDRNHRAKDFEKINGVYYLQGSDEYTLKKWGK